MLLSHAYQFPQTFALSFRHMAAVATPLASHAWVGPRRGVEQLRKIKVPQQTETESLRPSQPWQRGEYYLQSPLLSSPGASQTGSGDNLAATLEKMPVSLQINLPVESTGFPPVLVQIVLSALLVLEIPWCEQLQTMKIRAMDFLVLLLPLTHQEIIPKINGPVSNYSQLENLW